MQRRKQKLSQFYDISIEMEPKENYLPHIYARHGQSVAMFSTQSGELMEGQFPERESNFVAAWVLLHQQELKKNWENSLRDVNYRMITISPLV